jgi:hypothetical protein
MDKQKGNLAKDDRFDYRSMHGTTILFNGFVSETYGRELVD